MNNSKTRHKLGLFPALVFWCVSVVFFIIGLNLGQSTPMLFWISIALAISITLIQIMGNDADFENMGAILLVSWIMSYALGIGSNVAALIDWLQIPSETLEWIIAISLGSMIEITPERLFVMAWRALGSSTKTKSYNPIVTPQRPLPPHVAAQQRRSPLPTPQSSVPSYTPPTYQNFRIDEEK